MWSMYFCVMFWKLNFVDGFVGGGDGLDFVFEIDFVLVGEM